MLGSPCPTAEYSCRGCRCLRCVQAANAQAENREISFLATFVSYVCLQAVLQGDADSLAAQLAWMRLQNQGSEPYGLISPAPPASSDFQGHAVRGSAHDSVRSLVSGVSVVQGPELWLAVLSCGR